MKFSKILFLLFVAVEATAQPAGVRLDTLTVKHIDFQGRTQRALFFFSSLSILVSTSYAVGSGYIS